MASFEIITLPSGPFKTNAYLVISDTLAAIIDPAPGSKNSLDREIAARKVRPIAIIITHSHWDHIADVRALQEEYFPDIIVEDEDAYNVLEPGSDRIPCWMNIKGATPTRLVHDGDKIQIGEVSFRVIHTPGHTPGSMCLYAEKEAVLFSGDTLFRGTMGNFSFPTSDKARMWTSLRKLSLLPNSTRVYPGHGETTTIGEEEWLAHPDTLFGR
jgi:glyoxylase-like metal-dependent hydrolase (beta-lactamase superfamily II)